MTRRSASRSASRMIGSPTRGTGAKAKRKGWTNKAGQHVGHKGRKKTTRKVKQAKQLPGGGTFGDIFG